MKQIIKTLLLSSIFVLGVAVLFAAPEVSAQNALQDACAADPGTSICKDGETGDIKNIISTIVKTLMFIVGVLAVIMIIVGGIRYTVSGGDSGAVNGAKNTIFYAVIGLIVAIAAFAIVDWVIDLFI